jgi:hypothetical protein
MSIDLAHVVSDDTDLFDLAEMIREHGDLATYRYEGKPERISVSLDRERVYAVGYGDGDDEWTIGEYRELTSDGERIQAVRNLAGDMLEYWRAGDPAFQD